MTIQELIDNAQRSNDQTRQCVSDLAERLRTAREFIAAERALIDLLALQGDLIEARIKLLTLSGFIRAKIQIPKQCQPSE